MTLLEWYVAQEAARLRRLLAEEEARERQYKRDERCVVAAFCVFGLIFLTIIVVVGYLEIS